MIPHTPARDALAIRLALAALRGLGVVPRGLARAVLAAARWAVPSVAAPRRTTASGLTIAAVLAVITGDLAVPLVVLAVWLTVAWAGRRMTARAIRAGRIPAAGLRTTTRTATRAARREIERGL